MDNSLAIRMEQGNIDFWKALLSGAAAAKVIDIGYNYLVEKRKAKKQATESIDKTVQIYTALQSIPDHQCLRRNIFKAHNGGKMLDTRTHKYVSLLYEDYRHPFESTINDIQQWRVDEGYLRMLAQVSKEKIVHLYVNDVDSKKLKNMYESQDVKYASVHYIGEDGMNLYYASFASNQDIPQFDVDTRAGIDFAIDKITRLMNF